jgi:hypothetical protein
VPAFCKLDVENYEFEALSGLGTALPALSFEYYPPSPEISFRCLGRLQELGDYEYNWSYGETLRLNSAEWLDYEAIKKILGTLSTRYDYGDVYARLRRNY